MRGGSDSPIRHRKMEHYHSYDFDRPARPPRGRGFRGGRGLGRLRDSSPPYGRGMGGGGGGRSFARGFDRPGFSPGPFRGEGMSRNNPNVSPREGDWICSDPLCGNLNFARREYCNNCNGSRFGPGGSPRRNYPGPPPPHAPAPRFSGPPVDRSPVRGMNGYRSPPSGWGRDDPIEFGGGPPQSRHSGRFPDRYMRRERPEYLDEDEYRERGKFNRPLPSDWGNRGRGNRGRGRGEFNDRRGYDGRSQRRPPSPPPAPLPPYRGRWVHDIRERSRSPIRGGPPPKDYRGDAYMNRVRDDRRALMRERVGDPF